MSDKVITGSTYVTGTENPCEDMDIDAVPVPEHVHVTVYTTRHHCKLRSGFADITLNIACQPGALFYTVGVM
jgi:hypothetical protein